MSWEAERGPDARIGVDMRLFDHRKLARVSIKVLDGDHTWKVLGRYTKPGMWITPAR